MKQAYQKLLDCEKSIRKLTDFVPRVALVLGSGLDNYASKMKVETTVDYKDIEGFPVSTAPGHVGRFIFGYVGDVPVICMQGRIHYYEGYDISDVVLPVRLAAKLGAKTLFLTNASGGIGTGFKAGDLMLITDHIASMMPSPLRGANVEQMGVRFPDMSFIYSPRLLQLVRKKSVETETPIKEGIYIQTRGPQYESPAEISAYRIMGADAVGMSTAVEAIAARHMGMEIVGISCVCNLAAGISPTPLSEQEVLEAGKKVSEKFSKLVTAVIEAL